MKPLYAILLFANLFLLSCSKKDSPGTTTVTSTPFDFYLVNNTGHAVNMRMYKTMLDYRNSTNAVVSMRMDTGSAYHGTIADAATHCFVDWYTDDYVYTNWGVHCIDQNVLNTNTDPTSILDYVMIFKGVVNHECAGDTFFLDYSHYANPQYPSSVYLNDGNRQYFIDTNKAQTHWRAVDVLLNTGNSGISMWNMLNAQQRDIQLTLYKDLTFSLRYYDSAGIVRGDSNFYFASSSNYPRCYLAGNLLTAELFTNHFSGPGNYSKDTFFYNSDNRVIIMARDK